MATSGVANVQTHSDLTAHAINDLRRVFDLFDLTKDRRMDLSELRQVVRLAEGKPPSPDTVNGYLRHACRLSHEQPLPTSITFQQFLDFFAAYKLDMGSVHQTDIFRVLDEDQSGSIGAEEMINVMRAFGVAITFDEAQAMTDAADHFNFGPSDTMKNQIDMNDFAKIVDRVSRFSFDSDNQSSSQ